MKEVLPDARDPSAARSSDERLGDFIPRKVLGSAIVGCHFGDQTTITSGKRGFAGMSSVQRRRPLTGVWNVHPSTQHQTLECWPI